MESGIQNNIILLFDVNVFQTFFLNSLKKIELFDITPILKKDIEKNVVNAGTSFQVIHSFLIKILQKMADILNVKNVEQQKGKNNDRKINLCKMRPR